MDDSNQDRPDRRPEQASAPGRRCDRPATRREARAAARGDVAPRLTARAIERVMGFCAHEEDLEFMRQAPDLERNLARSGLHQSKFWFSASRKEQRRRFRERESHPLKQWRLSPVDLASLDRWADHTKAKEAMFFYTDTADAPWTGTKSDCRKRARLNAMRYALHKLPCTNKNLDRIGPLDPLLVGRAHVVYERGEHRSPIL